jgi:hypothetical protein
MVLIKIVSLKITCSQEKKVHFISTRNIYFALFNILFQSVKLLSKNEARCAIPYHFTPSSKSNFAQNTTRRLYLTRSRGNKGIAVRNCHGHDKITDIKEYGNISLRQ